MLFNGLKICILSGFSGFTKLSGEIIGKNISKNGGLVIAVGSPSFTISELFCMIVPEHSELSAILKLLNLSTPPLCPFVTPDWAISSLTHKTLKDVSDFQLSSTVLPLKRSPRLSPSPPASPVRTLPLTLSPELNRTPPNKAIVQENHILREDLLQNRDKFNFSKEQHNLNEHITSVLEILMDNYFLLKDRGRAFAYRFAIVALKSLPEKIICVDQVEKLQKVGKKIKKKIQEILDTGNLKRVKAMEGHSRLKSIKEFSLVWGIGSVTADKLFSLGYRSIQDLRARPPEILNENQRVCLQLHEELLQRIPRDEVKAISDIVVENAKEIFKALEFEANTCGSYRRGKETCGDIDVLITFEDIYSKIGMLGQLVDVLKAKGIVTHVLVLSEEGKRHENFTFEGIARLDGGLHRRLDIKIYPKKFYAWALMHFTGSANFNRSIRLFAKTKGLKLTDEGIFPAVRKNGETHCGACLAQCYTEHDIFNLFGMDYKPPEQRDL